MLRALSPSNIIKSRSIIQRPLAAVTTIQMRNNSTSTDRSNEVKNITVFGAGLMGAGIAQVAAQNGYRVVLSDVTDKALENGLQIINKSLSRVAKKLAPQGEEAWKRGVLERIQTTSDAENAVQSADLVIEAIIENIKIKRDLFGYLDTRASKDCIFASNTSSLSISEIAKGCSEERKTKFAGLHFFNPVPAMRLVEIIKTEETSPDVIEILTAITGKMGKKPVHCKDTPGFIVNRLLIPYLLEAIRLVERGDATPEDIDTAMELGTGYPMGPFKLLDFVGLDTTSYIAQGWEEKAEEGLISKEFVKPIPLLKQMIKDGKLGKKSGQGFYDYSSKL